MSSRTIQRGIACLEDAGYIEVKNHSHGDDKGRTIRVLKGTTKLSPPHDKTVVPHDKTVVPPTTKLSPLSYNTEYNNIIEGAPSPEGECDEGFKLEPPSSKIKKSKAKPSGQDEVTKYMLGIDQSLTENDCQFWYDSMESGGWMRGKKKIQDWQAAARSWIRGGWLPSQKDKPSTTDTASERLRKLGARNESDKIQDDRPRSGILPFGGDHHGGQSGPGH